MQQRMWGADAEALEALGRDMQVAATRLDSLARQISAHLMSSPWDGADADRFRADWNRRYRGQMRSAAEFLRHAQRTLTASGQDQRQASADRGELAGMVAGAIVGMSGAVGSAIAGWDGGGPGLIPDWARHLVTGMGDPDLAWEFISEVFPLSIDLADEVGLFSSWASTVLGGAGGALGFATGFFDLQYEQKYEGNFGTVEILADAAGMLGGGLSVIGAVVTATPVWPIGLAIMGVGQGISLGSKAVSVGLDSWDTWGRDAAHVIGEHAPEVIDAVTSEIDERWDSAYEAGKRALDDAGEWVDEAAGAVGEAASGVWETVTGGWPW